MESVKVYQVRRLLAIVIENYWSCIANEKSGMIRNRIKIQREGGLGSFRILNPQIRGILLLSTSMVQEPRLRRAFLTRFAR